MPAPRDARTSGQEGYMSPRGGLRRSLAPYLLAAGVAFVAVIVALLVWHGWSGPDQGREADAVQPAVSGEPAQPREDTN